MNDRDYLLACYNQIRLMEKHPFLNKGKIKTVKKIIHAMEEGTSKDVLVPSITGTTNNSENIDKNNYALYSKQVEDINQMYNNRTDYGGEFLKAIVDTLVAFIIGEGINIKCSYDKTIKWIDTFLCKNKMRGSKLLNAVLIGVMEGKCLFTLQAEKDKSTELNKGYIRVRNYSYYRIPYDVKTKEDNDDEIEKITYQKNETATELEIAPPDKCVYVKLGGSPDRLNRTPPQIANILTDIENASRCKYDIRKNNHLFGRVTPYFKTESDAQAKSLYNRIVSLAWTIGRTFVGQADFKLVEPTGNAVKALIDELLVYMKHISLNTGIPLQWLAYPEILSNRATADTMIETINYATIKDRTIWEEALTELIRKAMVMAFEKGWISLQEYKPDDFEISIPQVSIALLNKLMEVWVPLAQAGYISDQTIMSMIPNIDPAKEKELIQKQKEENMENFKNNMLNTNNVKQAQEGNNNQSNIEENKEEGIDNNE